MLEKYLKYVLGISEVKIRDSYIIGCDKDSCVAKGFLILRDVSKSIDEFLDTNDLIRFLNSYVKVLSKPFPIEIRTIILPIDKEKLISKIDNAIQTKEIIKQSDPSNEKIATEIERLKKLKKKILEGETPFNIAMILTISSEGKDENEARDKLMNRIKILQQELSDLGIVVEEVRGLHILEILNRFFRV
ncbi:MAG: hypothetical protein ACP5I7_05750 [Sulfolobales archaeon]|jgi:hypothetical protein